MLRDVAVTMLGLLQEAEEVGRGLIGKDGHGSRGWLLGSMSRSPVEPPNRSPSPETAEGYIEHLQLELHDASNDFDRSGRFRTPSLAQCFFWLAV